MKHHGSNGQQKKQEGNLRFSWKFAAAAVDSAGRDVADNVEVEETGETDDSDNGDALQLEFCATYQDIIDNAYEVIIASNMAQTKESELTFFEESNENLSEQTVQAAYFDFLSGDVSLLEDIELGQYWVDFILPNGELNMSF